MSSYGRPRAQSVKTQKEYEKLYDLNYHQYVEEVDEFDIERNDEFVELSYPRWLLGNEYRYPDDCSSSSSVSDSTDDSVDVEYTKLEVKHFQNALDQGVLYGVSAHNKRDRRKSFDKTKKRSLDDISKLHNHVLDRNAEQTPRYLTRTRSATFTTGHNHNNEGHRRKKDLPKHRDKIRHTLSNSGINFHEASSKMSIDEIYELQQRFYSGLKFGAEYSQEYSNECIKDNMNSKEKAPEDTGIQHKEENEIVLSEAAEAYFFCY